MTKENLENILKLPISDLEFFDEYVEAKSYDITIGIIPIIKVEDKIVFDTDSRILNNLKWGVVYFKIKDEIDALVKKDLEREDIKITSAPFRRLYVRDEEGVLLDTYECIYENKEWSIVKESKNIDSADENLTNNPGDQVEKQPPLQ